MKRGNKKGFLPATYIGWVLTALGALVLGLLIIWTIKGDLSGGFEAIKNLFRFGGR